jgi:predicted alpha/beta hydrolase family esterase
VGTGSGRVHGALLVASSDDQYVTLERARTFAEVWGSRLVIIGRTA